MNWKPETLLVFLALLTFAGQLWASPFLECHQYGKLAPADRHEADCHTMLSAEGAADPTAMESPGSMDDGMASDAGMGGCEQVCFHCPPGQIAWQAAVLLPPPSLEIPTETFVPPSRPDGLFRPPISA